MTRRQRIQRFVTLLIVALVLVLVGYFVTDPTQGQRLLADLGLTAPPDEGYRLAGFLEAPVYAMASPIGGRVQTVLVEEGDTVPQGQELAQLDTALLQEQLAAAQAQRDAAQAILRALEDGPRPEDHAVAQASLALAQASVKAAQKALEAARALPKTDPQRKSRIAEAQSALDHAQADLTATQAQVNALLQGAAAEDLAQARAALAQTQAEVDRLQAQIAAQTLQAPIAGQVLEVLLRPGEVALPGQPVVRLADLSALKLVVYVPEADLGRVRLGQQVRIKPDALPDQTFTGTVTRIAEQAEYTPRQVQSPRERTILVYAVEITVPNPTGQLKPGMGAVAVFP